MKITKTIYSPARDDCVTEFYSRRYTDREGLRMVETMAAMSKSDFIDTVVKRFSEDNGRTWSEWEKVESKNDDSRNQGIHQLTNINGPSAWNPVHRHTVSFESFRIWKDGVDASKKLYSSGDSRFMPIHSFINVKDENGCCRREMVKYAEGDDFDPSDWLNPSFFFNNVCYVIGSIIVEESGDILFTAEVPMRECCRMLGADINDFCPSAPNFPCGIIVMRGHFDGERYDLTCGRPIVISEKRSTRGFNEPIMTRLNSGRIIVIIRGSNAKMSWLGDNYDKKMPGHKWFAYSDDGGRTFTDPVPWQYDNGEPIYSSASCSKIIEDFRTHKHYWIGNITSQSVNGNDPRYPLCIVELDEDTGLAKKSSYTVIDTKQDGDPDTIQLSNFELLQNRETGELEIMLSKLGQYYEAPKTATIFKSDALRYIIEL